MTGGHFIGARKLELFTGSSCKKCNYFYCGSHCTIGKRGIMQGIFELVTIITLGSAAGDPMFYKKVGLLPAILVFVAIVLRYRITNYFVARHKPFEHIIQGRHVRLIKDRRFSLKNIKPGDLVKDEILSDLRMHSVSHLGQVDAAYIEASGRMSIFFCPMMKLIMGFLFAQNFMKNN